LPLHASPLTLFPEKNTWHDLCNSRRDSWKLERIVGIPAIAWQGERNGRIEQRVRDT